MNRKQLGIIFGVLAVLILIYAIGRLGSPGSSRPLGDGIPTDRAIDSTTALIRVVTAPSDDTVRVERREGRWQVNGHSADAERIGQLVGTLDTARIREVIARSPDNHARLGVDDASASRVSIGDLTFLLGRSETGSYYARLPNRLEVYLFPPQAGRLLLEDENAWRDHMIAQVDTSAVRGIAIIRPDWTVTVRRAEDGWLIGDLAADSIKVRDLLRQVSPLRAAGFPTPEEALAVDFENPNAVLNLYTEEMSDELGPSLSLLFVREPDEGVYLVRRADGLEVFQVPEWAVRRLLPDAEELIAVSD
jgi:hypothetical protein